MAVQAARVVGLVPADRGGAAFRRRRSGLGRRVVPTLLAALVAAAALGPVVFIVAAIVEAGPDTLLHLIWRPRVGELLVNTALLEATAIPLAAAAALGLAWLTERTDLPARRLWSGLVVAPLAVPAFVHSYAWTSVAPSLHGLPAALLVSCLAYLPFVYLPVAAQLRRIDPALEESAASLGLSRPAVFRRVVVPQLRVALSGGCLLVGLHLLAEYGLFALVRFETFATAIVDAYQSAYNGPAATALSGVLVLLCCALIGAEWLARGGARYSRLGSGAARPATPVRLGLAAWPILAGLACLAALSLGVPLVTVARWLVAGGTSAWAGLAGAFAQTLALALAGAALAGLCAAPMAALSARGATGRLGRALEICHFQVGALPGVVVALAIVVFASHAARPLYQTTVSLLLAYVLLFLPRAIVGTRAGLAQVAPEVEAAAASLRSSPASVLARVTLPLAAPGIAASFAFVAIGITTELTATLLLAPNGTTTLATEFWSLTSELDYAAAAPYAAVMVLLSLPLTILLDAQSRRTGGR